MILKHVEKDLRSKTFVIGTPAYGGQMSLPYVKSLLDVLTAAKDLGLRMETSFIENESLITRARNNISAIFLINKAVPDVLLFIDADIQFSAYDAITLVSLCSEEMPIVGASYPKKNINWENVHKAVLAGISKEHLEKFIGDSVINILPEYKDKQVRLDNPIPVLDAGTGFLAIHRSAFIEYAEAYPELRYIPDYSLGHSSFDDVARRDGLTAFFDTGIVEDLTCSGVEANDPGRKRYLSEDYMFMHNWRMLDKKNPEKKHEIYVCPWINLVHHGTYRYNGNLVAIADMHNRIRARDGEASFLQTSPNYDKKN